MKFGNFKLGKKDKDAIVEEIDEEEIEVPIDDLVQNVEMVKPHPPLQELSLEAEINAENDGDISLTDPLESAGEEGEAINLVEVQPDPAAASQPLPAATPLEANTEPEKKNDNMDLSASISSIFTDEEDEDNPLSNLIKSLPEVNATELIDDLKEISDIIKDWQKK